MSYYNLSPKKTTIMGAALSGSSGSFRRTYAVSDANLINDSLSIVVQGAPLMSPDYSVTNNVISFNVAVYDDMYVELSYFVGDESLVLTPSTPVDPSIISSNTIRADIHTVLFSVLRGASLTPLPYIRAAYSDADGVFPLVVVRPAIVNLTRMTHDALITRKSVTVILEVYSRDASDIDVLGDAIANTSLLLNLPGLTFLSMDDNPLLNLVENDQKVRGRVLSFSYYRQ